jgi:hypothetical protein
VRQLEMPAFVEQMKVNVAQQQAERVRILGILHGIGPVNSQPIRRPFGNEVFEQSVFPCGLEFRQ